MKKILKHSKANTSAASSTQVLAFNFQAREAKTLNEVTYLRMMQIAMASCVVASCLAAPVLVKAEDSLPVANVGSSAQAKAFQAYNACRHFRSTGQRNWDSSSDQFDPNPLHQPPRDSWANRATPAPFFTNPTELTPPANAVPSAYLYLNGVDCTSTGNCVAVGLFNDSTGSGQGMIFTETNGVWAQGVEAELPVNAVTTPGAQAAELIAVTCTSPGNCVAVGNYIDTNDNSQGLIVNEIDGVWAKFTELNPPANANDNPGVQFVFLNDITCTSPNDCVVTGGYVDNNGNFQGLVASENHGVWEQGVEITLPANAAPNPLAGPLNPAAGVVSMGSVLCFSHGNCIAGGQYTDTNQNSQPMITTETNGVWAPAIELSLPANAATAEATQNGFLASLVCFGQGDCTLGGGYNDVNNNAQPMIINQINGVWTQAFELTLPANAATAPGTQSAYLNGLVCTSRGNCAAYSAYNDLEGNGQPLVITETGGVWAQGVEPTLPANAITTPGDQNANINTLSCTSPGVCTAAGQYTDSNGNQQPLAYTTVPSLVIITTTLPSASVGADYWVSLSVAGGTGHNTWSVSAGSLPTGLTLNAATGEITGKPTMSGTAGFTITVIDTGTSPGQQASAAFTIDVRKQCGKN